MFNDNAAAVSALKNEQIDGLVVDLPTAFYLVAAEIDDGVIVGQLPGRRGRHDRPVRDPAAQQQPADRVHHARPSTSSAPTGPSTRSRQTWLGSDAGAPTLQ